ncbi:MAG TPA: PEP-CTERM sorting domain-containing protein [Pirellulales bacterium]|nr:PEP-CTERM sorting domain-containing protein [Pirellulales bacterium]
MKRVFASKVLCVVSLFGTFLTTSQTAQAGALHTPVLPAWGRPANNAAASAAATTYQEWNALASAGVPTSASPQTAPTLVNPNAGGSTQPVFYDDGYPADGAFPAGTDIYSFSGVLNPVVTIPGYDISGNQLKVQVEVQSFGSLIDASDLTASYTDPLGNAHSILVSTLPSFVSFEAYNDGGSNNGFGTAYTVDNLWLFTLPQDTANLTLSWGWGVTSAAIQAVSVDTHSVPEPSTIVLGLMAAAAVLWGKTRRRGGARS